MYTLIIGNKNYSSWSMRPWIALRAAGIAFTEQKVGLFTEAFSARVAQVSPAGLVPVLLDGDFAVWDSLAICEYAAERHPEAALWPQDAKARARARSLAAQMHSGFGALRQAMPMNVEAHLPGIEFPEAARTDVARVQAIWQETRAQFGQGGPFLFGAFSIADAFFAPVVSRFTTYGIAAAGPVREYMDAVLALPVMQEWTRDALAEATFVEADEPYRKHR
ncbi:glutathione S-transferase family protein [Achromobacter mucicolens]|uniref:Glutathione S-transferase family protein n=1 Tax=Achromobacter mucicolens TaxID=1389922 RepID=A0ABD4YNZ6_9BURK|nr:MULTISPECIES: glutathione S-transferase family protein [Achromobacter]MCU6617632.1 glutathione S-transferase family protein [Achromobacter mucicolens]MDH1176898.1 glutathione S-transferase family protein [Achromobacter mucicolens]UDG75670.1 glutathione S-transferase family protein [Achromobacter sp. 77]